MANKPLSYEAMHRELEDIIQSLQAADIDLEGAVSKYDRGMSLVADLENYLKDAQNKITKIKATKLKK